MKKLFDLLYLNKVTPNGLLVLHATYNNYTYSSFVNFRHEQHRLELTGYLKSETVDGTTVYKITDKGLHLIRESEKTVGKIQKAKKKNIPFSDWEDQIKIYNELFPAQKKPGTNYYFRTAPKELFSRFKWFFLEYPEYTWEDVFKATKKYVNHFVEANDYTYMQLNKYFIKKDDKNRSTTSAMATEIFNMKNSSDEEINTGTHYFGP
jgi:predicted transcriptional regulator